MYSRPREYLERDSMIVRFGTLHKLKQLSEVENSCLKTRKHICQNNRPNWSILDIIQFFSPLLYTVQCTLLHVLSKKSCLYTVRKKSERTKFQWIFVDISMIYNSHSSSSTKIFLNLHFCHRCTVGFRPIRKQVLH